MYVHITRNYNNNNNNQNYQCHKSVQHYFSNIVGILLSKINYIGKLTCENLNIEKPCSKNGNFHFHLITCQVPAVK